MFGDLIALVAWVLILGIPLYELHQQTKENRP